MMYITVLPDREITAEHASTILPLFIGPVNGCHMMAR